MPGEIAKIVPHKQWSYAGHSYLSGQILSTRLDVATLGLVPLRLEQRGTWDPKEEYWGEEGEVLDDRAKAIIAWGPRQSFEMEQLLPMDDPDDPDGDPIIRSNVKISRREVSTMSTLSVLAGFASHRRHNGRSETIVC